MSKQSNRAYSPYCRDAVELLGKIIRRARIEKKLTTQELADRAGISRGLLRRIETGDPQCAIGSTFEVATIVGVQLFDADQSALTRSIENQDAVLSLLPKAVQHPNLKVEDDF